MSAPTLLALSHTGAATVATLATARMPFNARVRGINVSVVTAPTGSVLSGTVTKKTGAAAAVVVGTWSIAVSGTSAAATMSATDGADEVAADDLVSLVAGAVGSSVAGAGVTAVLQIDQSADQDGVDVHSISVLRGNHPGGVVA